MSRTEIAEKMRENLDDDLSAAYARCRYLQIIQIELPESYESSIVDTQIEQQNTQIKMFEQNATLIRKQIEIMKSEADQNVTITNATAAANAYAIRQGAEVKIPFTMWEVNVRLFFIGSSPKQFDQGRENCISQRPTGITSFI